MNKKLSLSDCRLTSQEIDDYLSEFSLKPETNETEEFKVNTDFSLSFLKAPNFLFSFLPGKKRVTGSSLFYNSHA